MSKDITITSHELARKLLAGPDLPVFRHSAHDEDVEDGELIPLSHVEEIQSVDGDGDPLRKWVVIDTAIVH